MTSYLLPWKIKPFKKGIYKGKYLLLEESWPLIEKGGKNKSGKVAFPNFTPLAVNKLVVIRKYRLYWLVLNFSFTMLQVCRK